jgi:hypothetical protein
VAKERRNAGTRLAELEGQEGVLAAEFLDFGG